MSDSALQERQPANGFVGFHYVWGKLVDETGSILKGFEHSCTGRSEAFPAELYEACRPARFGVGDRSELLWRDSPWRDTGGFAIRPITCARQPWILAVRLVQRAETTGPSRRYTEAHYLAGSADAYGFDSPRRIAAALDVEPLRSLDMVLPPLELPRSDGQAALPSDWLARVEPLVVPILSAVPANEGFGAVPEQQLVEDIELLLAAVPSSLRWRLSIGIGITTVEEDLAVALSLQRGAGLSRAQLATATIDLSSGARYLEWLRRHCEPCRTFGELQDTIAGLLPALASSTAFPLEASWRAVSVAVANASVEQARPGPRRPESAAVAEPPLTDPRPPAEGTLPANGAQGTPDFERIEGLLRQFERLKAEQADEAIELAESCLASGAPIPSSHTVLSTLARLRAAGEGLPELTPEEARVVRRLATPMKVSAQTLSSTSIEPLLRLAVQRWPVDAAPFALSHDQLRVVLEDIALNEAHRRAWGRILRAARWTQYPAWRWVALEAVATDDLEFVALHALSGRALVGLIIAGAVIPRTAVAKILAEDVLVALPPPKRIDGVYLLSARALTGLAQGFEAAAVLDGLAIGLARALHLDEADVEQLLRAQPGAFDSSNEQQAEALLLAVIESRKPDDLRLYARTIVRGMPA